MVWDGALVILNAKAQPPSKNPIVITTKPIMNGVQINAQTATSAKEQEHAQFIMPVRVDGALVILYAMARLNIAPLTKQRTKLDQAHATTRLNVRAIDSAPLIHSAMVSHNAKAQPPSSGDSGCQSK